MLVINRRWYAAALLLAACGGGSGGGSVHPAASASGTVQEFMRAVVDSNLDKMAMLWGTAKGPAAKTRQPPDYERRIAIIRAYLNSDDYRILSDNQDEGGQAHTLQVQLRRQACTWTVPFGVAPLSGGGWVIEQIDLTAAGNPARSCSPGAQDSTATSG